MNILLVNYEYPPIGGGAANATKYMAKSLSNLGHNVVILTSKYKNLNGLTREDQLTVYRVLSRRKKAEQSNIFEMFSYVFFSSLVLGRVLKRYHIEKVLIFFSFPCGPIGLLSKFIYNTPYIISLRGGDVPGTEVSLDRFHKILKPLRRLVLKNSICNVANSIGLKELSEKADPYLVEIVPNGVDTNYFTPINGMRKQVFQFLFVGRFQKQKNLFFLLKHLSILKNKTDINFIISLVGDGPYKKDLIEYAKNLNIINLITWHGWVNKDELTRIYNESSCLVNPSLYEGLPNVILEAMACGLPVIASNVAGNNTLVVDNLTGLLFNLDQPATFQNALKRMVEEEKLRANLCANARKMVETKYSWDSVAIEYLKLFNIKKGL